MLQQILSLQWIVVAYVVLDVYLIPMLFVFANHLAKGQG